MTLAGSSSPMLSTYTPIWPPSSMFGCRLTFRIMNTIRSSRYAIVFLLLPFATAGRTTYRGHFDLAQLLVHSAKESLRNLHLHDGSDSALFRSCRFFSFSSQTFIRQIATIWIPTLIAFSFAFHLIMRDSGVEPWESVDKVAFSY